MRAVAIGADETGWSLARKLDRPSLALLIECAQRFARGDAMDGAAQDEAQATEAPQPEEDDLALDFTRPAIELERWVRAARPEPGARAELGAALVTFLAVAAEQCAVPGGLDFRQVTSRPATRPSEPASIAMS